MPAPDIKNILPIDFDDNACPKLFARVKERLYQALDALKPTLTYSFQVAVNLCSGTSFLLKNDMSGRRLVHKLDEEWTSVLPFVTRQGAGWIRT